MAGLLSMEEALRAVEEAFKFKGLGHVQMPPKEYLYFDEFNGDLRVMPAYIPSHDIAGVKIVNSHPGNVGRQLPTVMAIIELVEPATGRPLALMDGTQITSLRTGAASGVATKYLSRPNSETLCIIGAGAQSHRQLEAISIVRNLTVVRVFDLSRKSAGDLANYAKENGMRSIVCDDVRCCAHGADIIVTVTPSRTPVLRSDLVVKGTHVNAIGADAPGKQELDSTILVESKVIVDDYEQAAHSGEINVPLSKGEIKGDDIYGELGEIVAGLKPGRESEGEITVFDSTGLAIQDVAVGKLIYDKARRNGVGIAVDGLGY